MTDEQTQTPNADILQKIEQLESQILELQQKLEEAETAKLRALADLQNVQRRETENRKNWGNFAVADFVKKFLPTFLELSLGAEHSKDEDLKKVVGKFLETLQKLGVEKINPTSGEKINPDLHQVLMTGEGTPGTVVNVLEPGWKFGDMVLAPAKISGAAAA